MCVGEGVGGGSNFVRKDFLVIKRPKKRTTGKRSVSEWVEEGGGQQTAKYAYGLSGRLRS